MPLLDPEERKSRRGPGRSLQKSWTGQKRSSWTMRVAQCTASKPSTSILQRTSQCHWQDRSWAWFKGGVIKFSTGSCQASQKILRNPQWTKWVLWIVHTISFGSFIRKWKRIMRANGLPMQLRTDYFEQRHFLKYILSRQIIHMLIPLY